MILKYLENIFIIDINLKISLREKQNCPHFYYSTAIKKVMINKLENLKMASDAREKSSFITENGEFIIAYIIALFILKLA